MGLVAVAETAELISAKQVTLSETDKEFVVQFAFATGDKELTNKLIDELACEGADKGAVLLKYSTSKIQYHDRFSAGLDQKNRKSAGSVGDVPYSGRKGNTDIVGDSYCLWSRFDGGRN